MDVFIIHILSSSLEEAEYVALILHVNMVISVVILSCTSFKNAYVFFF